VKYAPLVLPFLLTGICACANSDGTPASGRVELREGLELHQVQVRELDPNRSGGLITLLYFDPARFDLQLLTAAGQGRARSADGWLEDFSLVAVINASMYLPNQRSTGLMVSRDGANNPAVNPRFGGFLAFGPVETGAPVWAFAGEDCDGFDLESLRRRYRTVVQNYRLLDCRGQPFEWSDSKEYSSAAVGLDRRGWLVFAHSGAACSTSDFARWLADDRFGLTDAHFVEGGAEASLMLRDGSNELRVMGSWPGVKPPSFREIPNVLGVVERRSP
jgi:uncharacterized protein YigE (DUF2233 family)